MSYFTESFIGTVKEILFENAESDINVAHQWAGGEDGKAILSFATHHGKILSNDQFANSDHKAALVSELKRAHALAHIHEPKHKKALMRMHDWANSPNTKVDSVYGK